MRHAARLPPPLVFNDRRLLLLIAFCKSQSIDHSFDVYVFCLRLTLAHFCRYLYVLDVCCQFASCQAMLAICKSYCKNVSEMHQQLCNNPLKFMRIHPRLTEMVPRSAPKATLGASRLEVAKKGAKSSYVLCFFGGFFATLRFWVPFWPQLGAKGVPKSSIWASRRAQSRKNSLQEEV